MNQNHIQKYFTALLLLDWKKWVEDWGLDTPPTLTLLTNQKERTNFFWLAGPRGRSPRLFTVRKWSESSEESWKWWVKPGRFFHRWGRSVWLRFSSHEPAFIEIYRLHLWNFRSETSIFKMRHYYHHHMRLHERKKGRNGFVLQVKPRSKNHKFHLNSDE